jgi:hypothetical protein
MQKELMSAITQRITKIKIYSMEDVNICPIIKFFATRLISVNF